MTNIFPSTRHLCAMIAGLVFTCAILHSRNARATESTNQARLLNLKGKAALQEGDDVMAREYYKRSLAIEESVDALCNLGFSEGRSKLYVDAYEHLRLCLYLIPDDEEFAKMRKTYAAVRDLVRREITFEEAHPIDERVDAEIERREAEAKAAMSAQLPASGLDEPEPAAETPRPRSAKLPVTLSIGSVGIVGVGTGVAFMVVGDGIGRRAVSFGEQNATESELRERSACVEPDAEPWCAELHRRVKKADRYYNAGIATLTVGGSLLVGATVAYFLWPEPKDGATAIRPSVEMVGTGGLAFGFEGTF